MTTPAQPPPPQNDIYTDTAAVLAAASTVSLALEALAPLYLRMKITHAALQAALGVVMAMPPEATGFHGPATAQAARTNLMRRTAFLVASARRMQSAFDRARAQRSWGIITDQLQAERRYYGQHLAASWARNQAASRIDSQSMLYGRLLGWYTVHTPTTTPECRQADHRNFWADHEPPIGWPGMAHPGCRCYPGPPIPGAPMVGAPVSRGTSRARVPAGR